MDERRADPDAILARIEAEETRARRGKLKIFFGATAGVGKTYAMLEAARSKRAEGIGVVVGYVELHGRPETERLLEGLECIPHLAMRSGGATIREFDLDAALERKPALILVDELAHTNAEGSRHLKRWQDIEELRDAGIDVYTTVNVQHLESLNDVVAGITGARQQETVPDTVFESADEVELVDLGPDDLLQRLREGKVYVPERARIAIENFFRKGNLIALRELALRKTAERVDAAMERWRVAEAVSSPWLAGERVMVALGPRSDGENLVRAGKRLATALRAPWIVVYVETPDLIRLPESERNQRIAWLRMAETLGGEAVTLGGGVAADELVEYARARNVSRLMLGEPTRRGLRRMLRSSTVDRVLAGAAGIDVSVVKTTEAQRVARSPLLMRSRAYLAPSASGKRPWRPYLLAVLAVAVTTLVGVLSDPILNDTNTALIYLAGIVLAAWRFGRGPSVLVSLLSVLTFNFFFVEPRHTFSVADGQYLVSFAAMMAVGLLVGQLMSRVRLQAQVAGRRERRTSLLYAMTRELAATRSVESMARVAVRHISEVFDAQVLVLLPDQRRRLRMPSGRPEPASLREVDMSVAQWVQDNGRPAGLGTDTLPASSARYVPLAGTREGGPAMLGVLAVLPANVRRILLPEQAQLLDTFAAQLAVAIERAELSEHAQAAQVRAETESVRNSLLSSISHDMRTPLAVISGAASSLAETGSRLDPEARRELAQSIFDETKQMTQLVTNVLDMIRLESGNVPIRADWISLEEIVGAALNRLQQPLAAHLVEVDLAEAPALMRGDPVLLEQLLFNLLENAAKYTPNGSRVSVVAQREIGAIEVLVADDGPGFPADVDPTSLFDKFQRGRAEGVQGGVGLGLAICRAIARAHGGEIRAERIPAGGALFVVTLPATSESPVMSGEDES
jgi:two-component system sensor histidine kinase KdpD